VSYNASFGEMRRIVPLVVTLAGVLDAIPLEPSAAASLGAKVKVFDAARMWPDGDARAAASYVFDTYANQTTGERFLCVIILEQPPPSPPQHMLRVCLSLTSVSCTFSVVSCTLSVLVFQPSFLWKILDHLSVAYEHQLLQPSGSREHSPINGYPSHRQVRVQTNVSS
jgi:hypothetical protein